MNKNTITNHKHEHFLNIDSSTSLLMNLKQRKTPRQHDFWASPQNERSTGMYGYWLKIAVYVEDRQELVDLIASWNGAVAHRQNNVQITTDERSEDGSLASRSVWATSSITRKRRRNNEVVWTASPDSIKIYSIRIRKCDITGRKQTPRISGENFTISRQRFALSQRIVAAHSKVVLVAWLKVWNAALSVPLHPACFRPHASADVLHLHSVVLDLETAVVERRRPRQMAAVLVNVEYSKRSFRFQRLA